MSTAGFRWARACFSTSLLAAILLGGLVAASSAVAAQGQTSQGQLSPGKTSREETSPERTEEAADPVAAEIALARGPGLYLRVDGARRVIDVKARGLVLESLPVDGVQLLLFQRRERRVVPPLPATWIVAEAPEASHRRRLTPDDLVPYQEDDAEETTAAPAKKAAAKPPPPSLPPAEYRVRLEGGWDLVLGPSLPAAGWLSRFWFGLRWVAAKLVRAEVETPDVLAIAVDEAVARKLHHMFRPGTAVLVVE